MLKELREMERLLEEISSDIDVIVKEEKLRASRQRRIEYLESVIRNECAEIKEMLKNLDNQKIADAVSKMVVNQIISPLQEAIEKAIKNPEKTHSIGKIAEDMKRKVELLSERHIRVIRCLSQMKGEWIDYGYLSSLCGLSKSCMRGYISDLKRVYDIPIETSTRGGKTYIRLDPDTIKRLALGYHALKLNAS